MPEISLKDHFDEKIDDLKEQNSREHAQVVERLRSMENRLGRVVTWPALATAVVAGAALYGVLQA